MSDKKIHQSNRSEYQIRVDGKPICYLSAIGRQEINEFLNLCDKNKDCYVDIVRVDTEIIMSQQNYHIMKEHFDTVLNTPEIETTTEHKYCIYSPVGIEGDGSGYIGDCKHKLNNEPTDQNICPGCNKSIEYIPF